MQQQKGFDHCVQVLYLPLRLPIMAKQRRVTSSKKGPKKVKKASLTLEQMLIEADAAFEALDNSRANSLYEAAAKALHEKLEADPAVSVILSKVLGKLGETKVSMGDQEGARDDFERAIALLNEQHGEGGDGVAQIELMEIKASLYLYMGQLSSNNEALQAYNNGVQLLEACLLIREGMVVDNETDLAIKESDEVNELQKKLCCAYCTIAELYMTDLCYDDDAEAACEASVAKAMKVIDSSDGSPIMDALQTMASLRISQSRGEEAIDLILETYRKMKIGCEGLAALVGLSEKENNGEEVDTAIELVEVEAANNLPGFEFRCQTARILLECASICKEDENRIEKANQCAKAAIQVLGSLLAENDEVIEIWYLIGCAFVALSPVNSDDASCYFEQALEMLNNVKESLVVMEGEDCEQLVTIKEQIIDVESKLKGLGIDPEDVTDTEMETT